MASARAWREAFELVVTPAIFGFFGYLLDRWLGTAPLFMLVFALFVFGYLVWKFWGDYERRMQDHEQRLGVGQPVAPPNGASRRDDVASDDG